MLFARVTLLRPVWDGPFTHRTSQIRFRVEAAEQDLVEMLNQVVPLVGPLHQGNCPLGTTAGMPIGS